MVAVIILKLLKKMELLYWWGFEGV